MGIMNFKPKDKTRDAELISWDELNNGANVTANIAQGLHIALQKLNKSITNELFPVSAHRTG